MLVLSQPTQAGYIVTLQQVGSDVVATGSGVIDLTGLTLLSPPFSTAFQNLLRRINPPSLNSGGGVIVTGPMSQPFDCYNTVSGPISFGVGSLTLASSGTGDDVGILPNNGILIVPQGYVSEASLVNIATWNGATFSSLGVTPGVYEWTWGTGDDQNFTLEIVSTPNTIDDCKNNGWQTLTHGDGSSFRNQGQCIQYVNTGK